MAVVSQEAAFIAALRACPLHPGARDLRDDTATLDIGETTLVLTVDSMVEGKHWLPGADMADVAWKLMATTLSDLAAKGADPIGVLLSHSLGPDDERFLAGLQEALAAHDVPLLGGDTVAGAGTRTFSCTAIGEATCRPVPFRASARVGDMIGICGTIGAAYLGFLHMTDVHGGRTSDPANVAAFTRPRPLLREGRALASGVHAMMDVSDGLYLDAHRMAEASSTTFALDLAAVPFARGLASAGGDLALRDAACRWGDDYALLFTAPSTFAPSVPFHRIGTVEARGNHVLLVNGAPVQGELGYQHG